MYWLSSYRRRYLSGRVVLCCGQMAVADFVLGEPVFMDEAINDLRTYE